VFDVLIRGGMLLDGTGQPELMADIGIQNGRIAEVGALSTAPAGLVIEADGKTVTPGFIDIHRHADAAAFRSGFGEAELRQGLTTIVNGNCGMSLAPFGEQNREALLRYLSPVIGEVPEAVPTERLEDYLRALKQQPLNMGMLVGGGTLRADIAGYATRNLRPEHIRAMQRQLEHALGDGALGVSLGMGYAPECFYSTEELLRVLAPLEHTDYPVTVHMREEGDGILDSVREMLYAAQYLRCPVHISHLKAMGKHNWNKVIPQVLELLTRARENGLDVSCDVYPYEAGSTLLSIILPPEFLQGGVDATVARLADPLQRERLAERLEQGGGFDNIVKLAGWDGIYLTSLHRDENQKYIGKSLLEIAERRGQSPLDACCDLLVSEKCNITMIDFMACEEDIVRIINHPLSNLISDATYPTQGLPHPRVYGSFTHLLTHYIRDCHALSLPKAIQKMTSAPAEALALKGKGLIAPGMDADLCIFDPAALKEHATYTEPRQCSTGMDYVLIGGEVVLEQDTLTGAKPGKVITK